MLMINYEYNLNEFIDVARRLVGRHPCSPLSLSDTYRIAERFGIDGFIYLEKHDETKHVNVLLELGKNILSLYDPLSGMKKKNYNEIQLGMYCKPVGSFRDAFQLYEQQIESNKYRDVWDKYEQRGKLLFDFLKQHSEFISAYARDIMAGMQSLQNNLNSYDCAPIALFMMSL